MDSRRLQHFLAVAECGGFTAAAAEVHVSQPALSLAVKELEAELGTPLFTRLGRTVRLTAAGQALVGPARQMVRDLETGRAAVESVIGVRTGRLSVASLPTLAIDPVAALVGAFHRGHPEVEVTLAAPEDSRALEALVRSGDAELGLTEAQVVAADLVAHDLGTQELLFIFPPGTVPERGGRVDLAALEGPFIAAPTGTSTRRLLEEAFAGVGRIPQVAVETAQRDAVVPLVVAGAGAALVPSGVAAQAAAMGAQVASAHPAILRHLALVHRDGPLAPAAQRFAQLAVESVRPARTGAVAATV
jgi:LysR family transcriptional regulator, carnitine catabolism transcriptional activator